MPDLIHILLDGTVGSEFSGAGHVHHSHSCPALLIAVSSFYFLLCLCIGLKVCQNEVGICAVAALGVQQRIIDLAETFRIIRSIFTLISCISTRRIS